ncbi:MAG: hypothetical protein JWN00_1885, partial [Actinomycetia bacterium]|nr:hypothetical protein [Actinomycetes bacterium]
MIAWLALIPTVMGLLMIMETLEHRLLH